MSWFLATVVNKWMALGLVVGAGSRVVGGQVISVTTGLAAGILLVEGARLAVWYFGK